MRKTIAISLETYEKLKEIKEKENLKSFEDVIKKLLECYKK